MARPSFWTATSESTNFPALRGDLTVDVAIVGAGITGITAAALLAAAGKSVALLEMGRVAGGETGQTTAHLTEAVDARYGELTSNYGEEGARLVAASSRGAIDRIESLACAHDIACDFRRLPGYLFTENADDVGMLEDELTAARRAEVSLELTRDVPLPFPTVAALRFENQAELHPRRYLVPLVAALANAGVRVFESTPVEAVDDGAPCQVVTANGVVTAGDVLVATNSPVNNIVALHTKIAAYRSYALAAPIARLLPGVFWDTADPYHYTRTHPVAHGAMLIVGGEDHKVGQGDEAATAYARLEDYARSRFGVTEVAHAWSGQIIEPVDGLPYIGLNTLSKHVYVATGFSGNGMTFGTVAAMIVADGILGRANPWASLYAATRVKPIAAAMDYVRENVDFPSHLVADRLTNADTTATSVEEVPPGEGRIVALEGRKYAVHRQADGTVHAMSPVCPHLGCDVRWNTAEGSWDCPCHGSRFDAIGTVINGPAVRGLAPLSLPRPAARASR